MKRKLLSALLILVSASTYAQRPFILTWEAITANTTLDIPAGASATYNYDVNFGDGTVITGATGVVSHTYAADGVYTVTISGLFPSISWKGTDGFDRRQLLNVTQWGDNQWTTMQEAFAYCTEVNFTATDTPDLSKVTTMARMFDGASAFNSPIEHWNVSQVKNMAYMFEGAKNFNQPLNKWNVSNVTAMQGMFGRLAGTPGPASIFNQPLDNWNVSNVTDMSGMFSNNTAFNQNIDTWNTAGVTSMKEMFFGASSFNQPLNSWDVTSVTDMGGMFELAGSFNQNLGSWDVSKVTNMSGIFSGATSFNQPIDNWDVSNVEIVTNAFSEAKAFNQPLSSWKLPKVISMAGMFSNASSFNQPLSNWDISNIASVYNMFNNASSFNQSLYSWNFSAGIIIDNFVANSGLNVANYDTLLSRFDTLGLSAKLLEATNLKYCDTIARVNLLLKGWTITGDTQDTSCGAIPPPPPPPTSAASFTVNDNPISIFPNPAHDYISLKLTDQPKEINVEIFDINGRKILTTTEVFQPIDISSLQPGTYILKAESGVGKQVFLFSKM